MTRINLVEPSMLSDKHLIAEHREIKRIPNCIYKGKYDVKGQPKEYTLGKGHVKFFYDKLFFLYKRYKLLYAECRSRGFNVTNYSDSFYNLIGDEYNHLWRDYTPTFEAICINVERINERTNKSNESTR